MCPRRPRRGMGWMSVENDFLQEQLALNERVLVLTYQLAWFFTMNLMDDAAILATIFT